MTNLELMFAVVRVIVRAPAHFFAAFAQAFDYVEHDVRQHLLAEPQINDSLQDSIMRESEEILRTGNQSAPVDIGRIAAN